MLDLLGDPIVWVDRNGVVAYANPAANIGIVGQRLETAIPELRDYAGSATRGEAVRVDFTEGPLAELEARPTGAGTLIRYRLRHLEDYALDAYAKAILEREERLKVERSLAHLDAVVESMADGLVIAEPDGEMVYWNPAALRIHGLTSIADSGRRFEDNEMLFHLLTLNGQQIPLDERPLARALRGETVRNFEARVLRTDTWDEWILRYNATPIRAKDGTSLGAIVTMQDVTDSRATEIALRETLERLALALQAAKMGTWQWDSATNLIDLSERAAEIYDIEPGPVMSWEQLREKVVVEDREHARKAADNALRTGGYYEVEYRIHWRDEIRWVTARGLGQYDADGQPTGMLGVVADVTEFRRADESLRESERRLRILNETLEEKVRERTAELEGFSYTVSHDLRAPLRAIVATSRMILQDQEDVSSETVELLQRQVAAGNHMAQLIDDLLQLARVSQAELTFRPFSLTTLAKEVAEEVQNRNPDAHAAIEIEPGMAALGDARLVRLLLQNLIENAVKFRVPDRPPVIVVGHDGEAFFVRDNGAGFDMEYAPRLFRPFERLHRVDEYPGTGIGLANVKRIVERHSGRVWAESQVGKGSTFYFTFGKG